MKRATDFMTENSNDDTRSAKAADTEIDLSSPGARLKAERERQGFEEEELATKLHITRHYLRAIEEDAYDRLPGYQAPPRARRSPQPRWPPPRFARLPLRPPCQS